MKTSMKAVKQVFIYSHGFGVRKDDRGLFTDVVAALPGAEHVLFDYNLYDEQQNTLTVAPLNLQAAKLTQMISDVKIHNPDAEINLICHSQGSVAAAMANSAGLYKTIMLAPPSELSVEHMLKIFGGRLGAVIDLDGLTTFPRRDGSTTIVPSEYWQSIRNVDPINLYNQFSKNTELCVITADHDEVLGLTDFAGLAGSIQLEHADANHDFTDAARPALIKMLRYV